MVVPVQDLGEVFTVLVLFCGLMTDEIDHASEAATGVSSGCTRRVQGKVNVVLRLGTR